MGGEDTREKDDEPSWLARMGLRYLRRRSADVPLEEEEEDVYLLDVDELEGLRSIERWTVVRAAVAGALSALASAFAELWAQPLLGPDPDAATYEQTAAFWGVVLGVTGVATLFEIAYLYFDALRSVHQLSRVAGLRLFPKGKDQPASAVATALARAALELPNPPRTGGVPVDPHKESSKLALLAATLVYKLKIGATNFLAKALLRRLLGRALVRVWLVFVAVPITAAWNGVVAWIVVREARLRAMGPSAARALSRLLVGDGTLSPAGGLAARRAVAACIVRIHDLHPNLVAMLREVTDCTPEAEPGALDDTGLLLEQLRELPDADRDVVLCVLAVSAILDGKVTRSERALVKDALIACGREPRTRKLRRLRRRFVRGQLLTREDVGAAVGAV